MYLFFIFWVHQVILKTGKRNLIQKLPAGIPLPQHTWFESNNWRKSERFR